MDDYLVYEIIEELLNENADRDTIINELDRKGAHNGQLNIGYRYYELNESKKESDKIIAKLPKKKRDFLRLLEESMKNLDLRNKNPRHIDFIKRNTISK